MYIFLLNVYLLTGYSVSELKSHYDTLGKFGCKYWKAQGLGAASRSGLEQYRGDGDQKM